MVTGLLILALLPASYAYIRGRGEFNDKRETEWLKSYAFPRLAKLLHKHDLDFDDLDEIIRSKVADLPEGYATYATYFAYNPERGQSFS